MVSNAISFSPERPYPTHAFPKSVADAILEVQRHVQAPMPMTALTFLSTMSAAIQGVADVQMPTGQIKPTSTFGISVGESGVRKSATDEIVAKPIYQRDALAQEHFKKQCHVLKRERDRWQATRSYLIRRIATLSVKGETTTEIERKLADHDDAKPESARLRRLLHQDFTYASVIGALEGEGESLFISASEGDAILKSDLMEHHFTTLNMAWSGESILTDRADGARTVVSPRCSMSLMAQPAVLSKYTKKRGEAWRNSGFPARCLFTFPQSTIGHRVIYPDPPSQNYLDTFHRRIESLLDEADMIHVAGAPRRIIEFDDDARYRWSFRANEVEMMMRDGGYLAEIRDFGSKLMEHVSRVAAILHVFGCQEGKITVDTVERAYSIVWFHAEEFRLLFSPSLEQPQEVTDAQKIERYLLRSVWCNGWNAIPRNTVLRIGPVRGRDRFAPAIDILAAHGVISITQAYRKAPLIVNLNPAYFSTLRL